MAIRTPPLFLGKAGILHPAQNDRLGLLGALTRPGAGLASTGGALIGPTGTMGELTLVSPTVLRIAPGRWLVPGMQNTLQGTYELINDANLDRAIPARNASQYRRALVIAYVADSSVTGGGTDTGDVVIVSGALSAVSPGALPDSTAIATASGGVSNYVALGEIAIPPTSVGTAVTLTAYNQRTGLRGGILPIIAGSAITTPGFEGAPGIYLGEYRDHPTRGLERWNGAAWYVPTTRPIFQGYSTVAVSGLAAGWQNVPYAGENWDSHDGHNADAYGYVIPPGEAGPYAVEGVVSFAAYASGDVAGPLRGARITVDGNTFANAAAIGKSGADIATVTTGRKILYLNAGAYLRLQGFCSGATWATYVDFGSGITSSLAVERLIG